MLESLGDGERGSGGELHGGVSGVAPAADLCKGSEGVFLEGGGGGEDHGGGAVGDGGGVGGGDGAAVGDEDGADGLELFLVQLEDYQLVVPRGERGERTFLCSSSTSTILFGLPLPPETSMGKISSLKSPSAAAFCAFL